MRSQHQPVTNESDDDFYARIGAAIDFIHQVEEESWKAHIRLSLHAPKGDNGSEKAS